MSHQLEQIKEQATKANITVQIMPFVRGAHPGMFGNFNILEFTDPTLDDLVYVEGLESVIINDVERIGEFLDRFEKLQEVAFSPEESIDFLDVLIQEMLPYHQAANSAEKEVV